MDVVRSSRGEGREERGREGEGKKKKRKKKDSTCPRCK